MTVPRSADLNQISQQMLYPLDDPSTAFTNALQDLGVNPYRSNPFTTALQKNAQGARIAYLAQMSRQPSQQALSIPGYANPSEGYGNFLRSQLQGGNMSGGFKGYAETFPNVLQDVRDFETRLNTGENPTGINPYTAALRDIFASDNGKGALAAYGSLRSPGLGSLAGSYTRALSNVGDTAQRNFAQQGGMNDDVWKFMFPSGSVF